MKKQSKPVQPNPQHGQIIEDLKQKIAQEYRTHGSFLKRARALRKKGMRTVSRVLRVAFGIRLAA